MPSPLLGSTALLCALTSIAHLIKPHSCFVKRDFITCKLQERGDFVAIYKKGRNEEQYHHIGWDSV
jgi:hypothetical protein